MLRSGACAHPGTGPYSLHRWPGMEVAASGWEQLQHRGSTSAQQGAVLGLINPPRELRWAANHCVLS